MQKENQAEFTVKKVIKGKYEKLYAEWKYYDSLLTVGLYKII